MKKSRKNLLIVAIFFALACHEQDEVYLDEPRIEFLDIAFKKGGNGVRDSLKLTIQLTDGNLDFGLESSDLDFPYQPSFYYSKDDGQKVSSDKLKRGEIEPESLIQLRDRSTPPYDTLPLPESSCHYYDYQTGTIGQFEHSYLYFEANENRNNIFIDFYYENVDGSFSEYDWFQETCTTFDGRIFPTNTLSVDEVRIRGPFSAKMISPKKLRITYDMTSLGFTKVFGSKKIKLRVYVKDQALNTSNIIETPAFLLDI